MNIRWLFPVPFTAPLSSLQRCCSFSLHLQSHAIFIFLDSLVDAGNNDYLVTLSKANAPPYGVDFAFSGGKPTGRFTNGMTIADILGTVKCGFHELL
jgi:hypothetical protein